MIAIHKIQGISFDQNFIYLLIVGKQVKAPLDLISQKSKKADDFQRGFYQISPSGYGFHWPLIDEDLSVEAIFKSFMEETQQSIESRIDNPM